MTIFYDPKARKARTWVFVVLVIIPLMVIILGWIGTRRSVEKEKIRKEKEAEIDIFDKF